MKPTESYALILTPAAGWSTPGIVRLRKLLKAALRGFGLRCIDVREVPIPNGEEMAETAEAGETR